MIEVKNKPDDEVIDEELFEADSKELSLLFQNTFPDEAMTETVEIDAQADRIDQILKRAKAESVVVDTTNFLFESFGRGLSGVTDAVLSVINKRPPRNDSF